MVKILARFYEELNDYLPPNKRKKDITTTFRQRVPVGEVIRRLGVPLEKVDLILVNSQSVGPMCLLENGDRVSVYPVFESFDIISIGRVRPGPLRKTAFLLHGSLVSLANALKKRGHDAVIASNLSEMELIRRIKLEKRILITVDKRFYQKISVSRILLIPAATVTEQVQYITDRLQLAERNV